MSVLGGLLGYLIGWAAWEVANGFFFTYIFSPSAFEFVSARYQENAFISILGAAFTPIPFKVFTVAAGIFQINLLVLIVASTIGRSARFFIEAGLIYYFGEGVKSLIDKYFNILSILFFILIVLGIIAVKYAL